MIDCTQVLRDPFGKEVTEEVFTGKYDEDKKPIMKVVRVTVGKYAARQLMNATKLGRDKSLRIIAVAQRLEKGGKRVEVAADDITMTLDAIEETARVDWIFGMFEYLLDRQSVADKDKDALAVLDEIYVRSDSGGPRKAKKK